MDATPTTGTLYCPPDLNLHTLEDPWLENAPNVSCIPLGTYDCIMSMSARFGKMMPQLLNVPGRTGIRIHGGNTDADTEGCILLGIEASGPTLRFSQQALGYFVPWLEQSLGEGSVSCEVTCNG